ncbi:MAG: hypothetical protein L6R41_004343 [Letrouitia leprolyta]|nr:MAG: hypothetical protein L6R41_004343 [Letrouitia leprolyta]
MSILERVQLCRVFDFPGVAEAVTEFGAKLESEHTSDGAEMIVKRHESVGHIEDGGDEAEGETSPETDQETHVQMDAASGQAMRPGRLRAHMIVIDNMANVVGSMMAKSQGTQS